jgi:hypothetical protein
VIVDCVRASGAVPKEQFAFLGHCTVYFCFLEGSFFFDFA